VTITVKDFLQNSRSEHKDYSALDEFHLKNENTVSVLRTSHEMMEDLNSEQVKRDSNKKSTRNNFFDAWEARHLRPEIPQKKANPPLLMRGNQLPVKQAKCSINQ
jgi:hypothetical protein